MSYFFHPRAEGEHLETIEHYESLRAGLGAGYLHEFERLISRVVERPGSFRIEQPPDIRRVSLTRFRYRIVYRIVGEAVQVLAVSHKRRRPGYWTSRLRD